MFTKEKGQISCILPNFLGDLHGFIDKKKGRAYHEARISSTFPVAPERNFLISNLFSCDVFA